MAARARRRRADASLVAGRLVVGWTVAPAGAGRSGRLPIGVAAVLLIVTGSLMVTAASVLGCGLSPVAPAVRGRRITKLTERSGSAAPALRKVVQLVKASAAGG
jgi:hypothetical protein